MYHADSLYELESGAGRLLSATLSVSATDPDRWIYDSNTGLLAYAGSTGDPGLFRVTDYIGTVDYFVFVAETTSGAGYEQLRVTVKMVWGTEGPITYVLDSPLCEGIENCGMTPETAMNLRPDGSLVMTLDQNGLANSNLEDIQCSNLGEPCKRLGSVRPANCYQSLCTHSTIDYGTLNSLNEGGGFQESMSTPNGIFRTIIVRSDREVPAGVQRIYMQARHRDANFGDLEMFPVYIRLH